MHSPCSVPIHVDLLVIPVGDFFIASPESLVRLNFNPSLSRFGSVHLGLVVATADPAEAVSVDSFASPAQFCGRAGLTFADFSVRSSEPMRWSGARALGLGLHTQLPVQIQLLCLRSAFGCEFLL
jgi:hypothetical protein